MDNVIQYSFLIRKLIQLLLIYRLYPIVFNRNNQLEINILKGLKRAMNT